jgi:hypothetical protein
MRAMEKKSKLRPFWTHVYANKTTERRGEGGTGRSEKNLYDVYIAHSVQNVISNILHYWRHNLCTLIVTYFIAVSFIETLVSAPWRWRDNNAGTYRN